MSVKFGLVGLGSMGILHSAILKALPNAQLTAIADTDSRLLKPASKLVPSIRFYKDPARMFAEETLDAVYLCTPVATHSPLIEQFLGASPTVALFVEKPLTGDPKVSNELSDRYRDRIVMVGYQRRLTGTFARAKSLLGAGSIGKPLYFQAHHLAAGVTSEGMTGWRFSPGTGGVTRELGAHIIDLLLWYFGRPIDVSAIRHSVFSADVEDFSHAVLRFPEGLEGTLSIGWSERSYRPPEMRIVITGSEGTIDVSDERLVVCLDRKGKNSPNFETTTHHVSQLTPPVPILLGAPENVLQEIAFMQCVRESRVPDSNLKSAAAVDTLIGDIVSGTRGHS